MTTGNRYKLILEWIFAEKYEEGDARVDFTRDDIVRASDSIGLVLPKNLGDLIYSFRYRTEFPESITSKAPEGLVWVIKPVGRSLYCFAAVSQSQIEPTGKVNPISIPDATPGLISAWALSDEQALLAKLRYNRLIDIFTGVTCYSLQNHLRTSVPDMGQVETDEVYIGVNRQGEQLVLPVQAKGGNDKLGVVQIEQDFALCAAKFPDLICRPIAAQFMSDDLIALFEFTQRDGDVHLKSEEHYRLASGEGLERI